MVRVLIILVSALLSTITLAQSIDSKIKYKHMVKDLEVFKKIRFKANSGLYKYRSKQQIDSIYSWAESEIKKCTTYREFFGIICQITDFEGSLHNDTEISKRLQKQIKQEKEGYFPYPIKWVDGKWRINYSKGAISVGSEIISINQIDINEIIKKLNKYYTTDGENLTGKRIGMQSQFSLYYRYTFGLQTEFQVMFKKPGTDLNDSISIKSIGYVNYQKNVSDMHSMRLDKYYYAKLKDNQKYSFKKLNANTGILTIYTFDIGGEHSAEHKAYVSFLDSTFIRIKREHLANLIVDIRTNGGGSDPNDMVTYSYLTERNFQENKQAWICFGKVPYLRYLNVGVPKFIRPFVIGKYNKEIRKNFPEKKANGYYQNQSSEDQKIRFPNANAFTGKVYLMVSPAVASAGSMFAAMVSGNKNTITIGEETQGGYYGHNGHTPISYKLPKSKIQLTFSAVNLEQDVPMKANQVYNRGIIPDIIVSQTLEDFLNNIDTQLNFTMALIKD